MEKSSEIVPEGFRLGGARDGSYGIGLIVAESKVPVAYVSTRNKIKAESLMYTEEVLVRNSFRTRAIVVNSGNANCFTGRDGISDAKRLCNKLERLLGLGREETIIFSTGVIGRRMNIDAYEKLLEIAANNLGRDEKHLGDFASAIMTTDTYRKVYTVERNGLILTGIAKGAGMIAPNLGTMLAFILTNARLERERMQEMLLEAVDLTFNNVVIDGDTSTNDAVVLLSSNKVEVCQDRFMESLVEVCRELAKMIAMDGEGATKMIELTVRGTRNREDARRILRSVLGSLLVKTAIFGASPNPGRILAVVGYSGVNFDPEKLQISIEGIKVIDGRKPIDEEVILELRKLLKERRIIRITIDLREGEEELTGWGCDLSYEYVRINAEYVT